MTDTQTRLRDLLDQHEIEGLLIHYCNRNDANDWAGMASVFTEEQRETLTKAFSGIRQRATTMMPIEHIDREQHILSNFEISVEGDTASSFSACRVYIVGSRGGKPIMLIRGITYTDKWVRTGEGWRIKERAHFLVWMTEATPIEGVQVNQRA